MTTCQIQLYTLYHISDDSFKTRHLLFKKSTNIGAWRGAKNVIETIRNRPPPLVPGWVTGYKLFTTAHSFKLIFESRIFFVKPNLELVVYEY